MFPLSITSSRIKEERQRCGLSLPQAAALANVTVDLWDALEAGLITPGIEFTRTLSQLGFDPTYIGTGERGRKNEFGSDDFMPSEATNEGEAAADQRERIEQLIANQVATRKLRADPFAQAVVLLQRSSAAVEAFVGSGASLKSPELVAALMNATTTLTSRDNMTGCTKGLENAIDALGGALSDAVENATEAISGVADKIESIKEG